MTKRWNGWGDDGLDFPINPQALRFLQDNIGVGVAGVETPRDRVLADAPPSRLKVGHTDAATRVDHARGQSYPDWLALKFGALGALPDAVWCPTSHAEVVEALAFAHKAGAKVVPYGGGTSVVGHLNAYEDAPTLSLSLEKLDALLDLNETDLLATLGAGANGPQVEKVLQARGYTLGHYPQSWEYSTVGGWVVTRSSGQQSLRYGRIEQLFAAGKLATFKGDWQVGGQNGKVIPASSAGPDLREVVLGSEGRLGILTETTVRIRKLPQHESFHAVFFPTWEAGVEAVRHLTQAGIGLSMLRLSNETETETQLVLAGHPTQIAVMRQYLKLRGSGAAPCMLMIGLSTDGHAVAPLLAASLALCKQGVYIGTLIGKSWAKNRFKGPYLRNSLWQAGYGADTIETCTTWSRATALMRAMETAAHQAFAGFGEKVHAFTHLSHTYKQGCSLYSTFVFKASPDLAENLARWRALKGAVSQVLVEHGGTISHQHGVGVDHAPYLPAEKGEVGMGLIKAIAHEFDPHGLMNPGKLFS